METHSPSPADLHNGAAPRCGDRTLPVVLLVLLGAVATLLLVNARNKDAVPPGDDVSLTASTEMWSPSPRPVGGTASMTIDFGNGARREFDALPWNDGMTLGDLMHQARDFRPGIAFTQQGEGKTALLTSLEGVANETGSGRYWLYSVDGRHGDTSFAIYPLNAGAHVLWEFRRGE